MSADLPMVSAIMPTMPSRVEFAVRAKRQFQLQTYPRRELLVASGPGRIGQKRNVLCNAACGEIIMHWDDDDWSAAGRMADQVARLCRGQWDMTGYHEMLFVGPDGERWQYEGKPGYAIGTSLCYWKAFWESHPFRATLQIGEDNAFQYGARVTTAPADRLLIATLHPGNTSPRDLASKNWRNLALKNMEAYY